ncbi:hypothetical protein KSP40_PGU019283 [Platanthera guangdongensis]|uniref:DUF4378 domain-containing protein n=1 Tax=Platanthera guangdongensis TaxID=2320717 RepID=A0ABR2MMR0_9ASPA
MSLTIMEKQPQRRPGGCAGIFFQLIDWNRRLARKKLFSKKKLLPPVRPVKRPDKKFAWDDKLPRAKLILIANENRRGFPNGKKAVVADENLRNRRRTPGLVARLMGLESMPDADHEKPRKTLDSEIYYDIDDESGDWARRLDRNLCHEKPDSRPQKLQKTAGGFFERKPVRPTRFCPDVIDKSADLHSRKQHKLVSTVKGPGLVSRGNQSRLMVAATKILEHGLQSRSTSRRSITCDVVSLSETIDSEAGIDQNDSIIGSCRSYGGVVDFPQFKCRVKGALGAHNVNASSQNSVQVEFDTRGKDRDSVERKYLSISDQIKCKHQYLQENNPKAASKSSRTTSRSELPMSRENMLHGAKLCSRRHIDSDANEFIASKVYVGAKKKLNSSPSLKSASKISTRNGVSTEELFLEKSVVHKRRSNRGILTGNVTASNPNFVKQRNIQSVVVNKKEPQLLCGHPINRASLNNKPQKTVPVDTFTSKDAGIVSFTFSSPIKHVSPSSVKETSSEKSVEQMKRMEHPILPKRLALNANMDISPSPRETSILRRDELRNLLEEKIRELNSLGHDDVGIGDTPGRSTASILKELISAITAEESAVQSTHFEKDNIEEDYAMLYMKNTQRNDGLDVCQKIQVQTNLFNDVSMVSVCDHPSPISIFDASFSCESSSIGSFNGGSDVKESKQCRGFTHKCNKPQLLDLDFELLDSAASVDFSEEASNSGGIASSIRGIQSLGKKISFPDKPISNIKFLLESIPFDSDNALQSSVKDMFTSISAAFFARTKSSISFSKEKVRTTLQNFLFDCLVERLDSRFSMSGYKMWLKFPFLLNKDKLHEDINGEIVSLMELAGKRLEGLAEQELSSSTISWTKFEDEISEIGVDMERAILQELVDETIADLSVASTLGSAFD